MPTVCWAGPASAQQVKELTFWSHWAAEVPKRTFVEEAIKQFEAKNPGIKIKQTWYEKTALYAGLKTALRANQAPDIFYAEPDQAEYMENALPARSLWAELGSRRAVGEGGLDLSGQAIRLAVGGLDRRALLQQEDHGGPRRERAG